MLHCENECQQSSMLVECLVKIWAVHRNQKNTPRSCLGQAAAKTPGHVMKIHQQSCRYCKSTHVQPATMATCLNVWLAPRQQPKVSCASKHQVEGGENPSQHQETLRHPQHSQFGSLVRSWSIAPVSLLFRWFGVSWGRRKAKKTKVKAVVWASKPENDWNPWKKSKICFGLPVQNWMSFAIDWSFHLSPYLPTYLLRFVHPFLPPVLRQLPAIRSDCLQPWFQRGEA